MAVGFLKARPPNGKLKSTSLAIVYKLVWNHPFIVFMLLLLIYLQWHFPIIFSLLVSASPVLVCTAFLLAALLIHGQPNDHKAREMNDVHTPMSTLLENTSSPREKDGHYKDRFAEVRKDIVEKGMKAYFAEFEDNEAQIHKFEVENMDVITRVHDRHIDYSLDKHKNIDDGTDHGSTDIESDEAEGSFLDALVGEGTQTHQETRPLLEFENHQHHLDMSHSRSVSPKSEEDEVVGSEDVEDGEEEEEEEEEEEDKVEKCEGEPVTMWTEEDEKNLRYLGTCELERNQCLENLIAKRRRQRNFSMKSERNLMDLNHYNLPTNFQVTHIVTATHKVDNPFGVANNTSPNSAPSATFSRKNPFDSPCVSPKSGAQKVNPFDVSHHAKEHVLRRYESFNPHYNFMEDASDSIYTTRSTFPNLFTLDKPTEGFHLKPIFVPEQLNREGKVRHVNHMDRQSSLGNESVMSYGSNAEPTVAHTNLEPEVTSMNHQDGERINTQAGLHKYHTGQIHHAEEGKDHNHHPSSSSSITSKLDDKNENTSQVEGEGDQESNLLPKSPVEESNINNKSKDEDPNKVPIYDTSPSGVYKNKSFSPPSEM